MRTEYARYGMGGLDGLLTTLELKTLLLPFRLLISLSMLCEVKG